MKNIFKAAAIVVISMYMAACSKQKSAETTTEAKTDSSEVLNVPSMSADSLEQLNTILLKALKEKDKTTYLSYCFTSEQEEKISQVLQDPKKQKYFQREFGFSLHEEVAYFENICKYIDKTGINLDAIDYTLIEAFDYNRSNYSPIVLKEVLIPIIQEGIERDIVYVAIQIDNKWYFTSELSL